MANKITKLSPGDATRNRILNRCSLTLDTHLLSRAFPSTESQLISVICTTQTEYTKANAQIRICTNVQHLRDATNAY
jgi:hypothetical protein